jgi:2-polyprenyl-6-methoxyphenol hydroxylase-like FAD-dependent oxidoreductase
MANTQDPILIVGGGLGGLTAALALGQRGIPVQVFEGAPSFGAIGYGIQFGPNVFHVFDRLGIGDAVRAAGDEPPAVLMLDGLDGSEVTRVPTGATFRARFDKPYLIIHRVDLHNVLLDACRAVDAVELVPDAMVSGFTDHGDHITIATQDGASYRGAALIGADGIGSTIRAQLFDDSEPLPNGYVAHRTIVPMENLKVDVPRDVVVLWGGPGFHIVHYPLRHGALFNIVAVFRSENTARAGDVDAYRAELQATYGAAHPSMQAMIGMMDLERRFTVGDRDPIRRWHRGRVTLLGDAAHPTLQSFAQGACMAIEDGLHIADLIAGDGDFESVFARFNSDRLLRTARLTLESRELWRFYHAGGLEREVMWQQARERDEADIFRCLAWLYDGFPFSGAR